MSKTLHDTLQVRHTTLQNRICVPPMVCFAYAQKDGTVSDTNIAHYDTIAQGGAGLIILEATCVAPTGMLADVQLGIWDDSQIDGLRAIADTVHAHGSTIVMQIHHAGILSYTDAPLCPSAYEWHKSKSETIVGKAMTQDDIAQIQQAFIDAARRAYLAGYDGVELHGCHSYLICQMLNRRVNTRTDRYGTDPILFVTEMMDELRAQTSDDFIIGIRLGAFEPALADGIAHAKALADAGIDYINVSYGFRDEMDLTLPEETPLLDVIYAAGAIRKAVDVPVFAVNSICTPKQAQDVLDATDVDMVNIGRSVLVDANWAKKALAGEKTGACLHCKQCAFSRTVNDPTRCAGRILLQRNKT